MESKLGTVNGSIASLKDYNKESSIGTEASFKELNGKVAEMGANSSALKKTLDDFKTSDASDDKKV
jgi:hypothetical protein